MRIQEDDRDCHYERFTIPSVFVGAHASASLRLKYHKVALL